MQRIGLPVKRLLTWREFDTAVGIIARLAPERATPAGVFGFERGGLPLAVALSHRLNVPLVSVIREDTLVVDDVFETGRTFAALIHHPPELKWVWALKRRGLAHVHYVQAFPPETWLVFPWETKEGADADASAYYASRE